MPLCRSVPALATAVSIGLLASLGPAAAQEPPAGGEVTWDNNCGQNVRYCRNHVGPQGRDGTIEFRLDPKNAVTLVVQPKSQYQCGCGGWPDPAGERWAIVYDGG